MPAEQSRFARQRHHALDARYQMRVIRIRQIGTPDRTRNDQIAADQQRFTRNVKRNVARRVSRRVHHLDRQLSDQQALAFGDQFIRLARRNHKRQLKDRAARSREFQFIERMNQFFCVRKSIRNNLVIRQVIEVSVRQPESDQIKIFLLDEIENGINRVIRRVEQHALFRLIINDEKTIRGNNSAGMSQNAHGPIVCIHSSPRSVRPTMNDEWEKRVTDGARTRDVQDHNLALYQLSYGHHWGSNSICNVLHQVNRS